MENRTVINLFQKLVIIGVLLIPFLTDAYYPITTHKGLTKDVILFFNKNYPDQKINSQEDIESVKKGSVDEDSPALRSANHFYDPIHNKGVLTFLSSKNWVQNTKAQTGISGIFAGTLTSYFGSESDYSWDRGIYEYAWGDKQRGLESLGHVLHLLEDASVPDHTRNDMHAGHDLPFGVTGISPYEDWTNQQFNESTIKVSDELGKKNIKLTICKTLDECFDNIARYSNENFFSKDTIFDPSYSKPVVDEYKLIELSNGITQTFGIKNLNGERYKIVRVSHSFDWKEIIQDSSTDKKYFINDDDNLILSDYWSLLSKQAVLHGAGVVKLFFDEVEKEKKTKELYNKNRSWAGKSFDAVKNTAFGAASIFYGMSVAQSDIGDDTPQSSVSTVSSLAQESPSVSPSIVATPVSFIASASLPAQSSHSDLQTSAQVSPQSFSNPLSFISRLFEPSGGGEAAEPRKSSSQFSGSQQISSASAESTASNSPTESQNPTPSPSESVSLSASSTASVSPSPSPSASPSPTPVATSTVTTSATMSDTQAPSISLAINECNKSLSSDGCLIATTTITLSWSSLDSDFAHYIIACTVNGTACSGFSFASTTATTTIYTAPADMTMYAFTAKAVDTSNNESNAQTISVDIWLHPIVINEIAWAGTGSSATTDKDEWVELYNPTSKPISLAGMTLNAPTNSSFKINLSGTLNSHDYYLIERTDDDAVSDIPANLIASFGTGLLNNGEQLALMMGSTTIDKTPIVGITGCLKWCAGNIAVRPYATMERYDPLMSGEDKTNWGTWETFVRYGANAEMQPIKGTPKHRNSVNYLIVVNSTGLSVQKTLTKANNPYVVPVQTSIGATLTIEPGVIIKFKGATSELYGNAMIVAQGTPSNPIIFTSFADDSYAGDTNQDGTSTSPVAGDWGLIRLLKDGSIIDHAIIRYGGGNDQTANIKAKNASVNITNSIIEYSKSYGISFDNASGSIVSNTIRNNNAGRGGLIVGGVVTIRGNTFGGNYQGLMLNPGTNEHFDVQSNSFVNNTKEAIIANNVVSSFSGNTANGNGTNGIVLSNFGGKDYTFQPDIVYVMGSFEVSAGKTVTIMPGVVIKFQQGAFFDVAGNLQVQGTAEKPIIFTSFSDDDCGIAAGCGDTDHASSTPQAGDWFAIKFESGSVSSLDYVTVRFGGKSAYDNHSGALQVNNNAGVSISHAVIEKNYYAGIRADHASPQIFDSLIQNHKGISATGQYYGMFLTSSSTPAIANTHFKNNDVHIFNSDPTSSYTDGGGNVFE